MGGITIQNQVVIFYSWLVLPTSNFWVNWALLPINELFFKKRVLKSFASLEKVDLILSQNIFPDSIVAYWLNRAYSIPYVINLRILNSQWRLFKNLPIVKNVIRNSSAVYTHSPSIHNLVKSGMDAKLILHPLDEEYFTQAEKGTDKLEFLSVCRLLKLKNLDMVLNALANLKSKGFCFEYKIIGDGAEMENLRGLIKDLGIDDCVHLEGFLPKEDVINSYKSAHVFIMPSYPETLGRVFLEAAAAGCLCIGHENTGIDGLFEHKKSALFVNRNTIEDNLEHVMNKFLNGALNIYQKESRQVVEKLTWENIGKDYQELFKKALSSV